MSTSSKEAASAKQQQQDDKEDENIPSSTTPWPRSHHANDGLNHYDGRDLVGYMGQPPSGSGDVVWPGGAKVALNFVVNYEEGGESCLLHGDTHSENLLSEIVGAVPYGTLLCGKRRKRTKLESPPTTTAGSTREE